MSYLIICRKSKRFSIYDKIAQVIHQGVSRRMPEDRRCLEHRGIIDCVLGFLGFGGVFPYTPTGTVSFGSAERVESL